MIRNRQRTGPRLSAELGLSPARASSAQRSQRTVNDCSIGSEVSAFTSVVRFDDHAEACFAYLNKPCGGAGLSFQAATSSTLAYSLPSGLRTVKSTRTSHFASEARQPVNKITAVMGFPRSAVSVLVIAGGLGFCQSS